MGVEAGVEAAADAGVAAVDAVPWDMGVETGLEPLALRAGVARGFGLSAGREALRGPWAEVGGRLLLLVPALDPPESFVVVRGGAGGLGALLLGRGWAMMPLRFRSWGGVQLGSSSCGDRRGSKPDT